MTVIKPHAQFMKTQMLQTLEAAERFCPAPRPHYWGDIRLACFEFVTAIEFGANHLPALARMWANVEMAARAAPEAAWEAGDVVESEMTAALAAWVLAMSATAISENDGQTAPLVRCIKAAWETAGRFASDLADGQDNLARISQRIADQTFIERV